jgi:2-polyprenyl-3-methyl-5-hydroxy-6-metoxy-1,4-benzoquinol methylase
MSAATFTVTEDELMTVFRQKYSRTSSLGWGPRMRLEHGYFTPDDYYEALVGRLLHDGAEWCDVGCGRNIFPENPDLAREYASRCRFVFGIDPDDNVRENALVNEYFQGIVEDCPIERQFDLVTLRMVAEHIENPEAALSRLARLLKPSGHAVIYTPHKWAPMSIVANVTPFGLHNPLKRLLWNSEARDTFPTQYKLNTRKDIDRIAKLTGLEQVHYQRLDDCRITNSYRFLNRLELASRSALHAVGVPYPEACILAVLRPQRQRPATIVN